MAQSWREWLGALPVLTEEAGLSAAPGGIWYVERSPAEIVGRYMLARYRKRVAESGISVTARQLRKQGVPLAVARVILLGVV